MQKLILSFTLGLFALILNAQESQSVEYSKQKGASYSSAGKKYTLRSETSDFGNPVVFMTVTYKSGNKSDERMYVVDHEAFPATFVSATYRGNAEMVETLKVVAKKPQDRLVFTDNALYVLTKWESKDEFHVSDYIKAKLPGEKKKGGGLNALKSAMKNRAKSGGTQVDPRMQKLQTYLNGAFSQQEVLAPEWEEKNQAYLAERVEAEKLVDEYVRNVNSAYWNSEEGQQKLKEMRQPKVKIYNDTSAPFRIAYGQGVSSTIEPGKEHEFACKGGSVYLGLLKGGNNTTQWDKGRLLLELDGNNCGTTYKASGL